MYITWVLVVVLVTGGNSSMIKSTYNTRADCFRAGEIFNSQVTKLGGDTRGFYTCTQGLQSRGV